MDLPPMVFDQAQSNYVAAEEMDRLWSEGWRHFGTDFFRYSISFDETGLKVIQPLRMDLRAFTPSKSQRRVLRKNADVRIEVVPAALREDSCAMFQLHKERFISNVPEHLSNFLGDEPGKVVPCFEFRAYLGSQFIASSYLDVGERAASSVYGIFDLNHSHRSLGIYTMLREIAWAQERGLHFYYPGYATREPSHYDYKKRFAGMSYYEWGTKKWRKFAGTMPDNG